MMRYNPKLVIFTILFLIQLVVNLNAALSGNPNPPTASNTVIDIGQISVVNSIISGGFGFGYSTNWLYVPPATTSNVVTGNLISVVISNTLPANDVFIINAISTTVLNIQEGWGVTPTNVITANLIST